MRSEKLYHGKESMQTISTDLLIRRDVAKLFQVSILSVIRWEAAGRLPAIRLGAGTVRYQRSAVEKLIQDSITPNGAA